MLAGAAALLAGSAAPPQSRASAQSSGTQAPRDIPPSTTTGTDRFKQVIFRGLSGPPDSSAIAPPGVAFPWRRYAVGGSPSRLAILLTDTLSDWVGLVHGLRTIGVPFTITRDASEAVRHRVVLVYPLVSGRALDSPSLHLLAQHPLHGGTLIASNVLGGLEATFGFQSMLTSRTHFELRFAPDDQLTREFSDPRERRLRLGNRATQQETVIGSYYFTEPRERPLATYEDGSAAITQRSFSGGGRAIAFGLDIGYLLHRGYNNRDDFIYRDYVNGFEPTLDVFLRLLRNAYLAGEPNAVVVSTVPGGRDLALALTHDIDYAASMDLGVSYARFEQSADVHATYFVQTKYVTDWNDTAFFDAPAIRAMRAIEALGGDIESHSVSHTVMFRTVPLGTGTEAYPTYRPRVISRDSVSDASLLGELRVSKFLLDRFSSHPSTFFRPGHLRNPEALPQALEATGYHFSSSTTANTSLTHLPYALTYGRRTGSETSIFEFPVTVEDEASPLGTRLQSTLALARQLQRYGALMVVLIHPNVLGEKLAFEQQLVEALNPTSWIGSLLEFATFWHARDAVQVDVEGSGDAFVLSLVLPEGAAALALHVPLTWRLLGSTNSQVVEKTAGLVVVDGPAGHASIRFGIR